jgi:hypothetical protein
MVSVICVFWYLRIITQPFLKENSLFLTDSLPHFYVDNVDNVDKEFRERIMGNLKGRKIVRNTRIDG